MNTKHTPGPWIVKPFDESQTVIIPSAIDGRQPLITTVSVGLNRPNGEANARLIAAAPELLEALQECVTDEGAYSMTRDDIADLKMRIATINAIAKLAINKAKGL